MNPCKKLSVFTIKLTETKPQGEIYLLRVLLGISPCSFGVHLKNSAGRNILLLIDLENS
jgi:hypothetical protein